jgi:hypothetical protein
MKIKSFLIFCCLWLVAGHCYAKCERGGGLFADKSISVSTIALPSTLLVESRHYSAGEVLYSSGWVSGSNNQLAIENCGKNYVVGFFYNYSPQIDEPSGVQIASTNVPGIGVRASAKNQAGPYDDTTVISNVWLPGDKGSDHVLRGSLYMIELVATGGPIAAGTLNFGSPLAQVEFRESQSRSASGDVASEVVLSSTNVNIKAMGCNADTSAIRFPFGSVNLNEFNGTNHFKGAADQSVTLSCEAGTNVSLSVSAQPASGDNAKNTIIALTGEGTNGVAGGIGVQLGLKSSSYDSGDKGLPLNQNIALFTSTRHGAEFVSGGASAQESLIFSALYYKTGSTVTPGSANAVATLNFYL